MKKNNGYRRNMDCYRSNGKCYMNGQPHQKGDKKTSKNSRSLIHNLALDPTTNSLRMGELYPQNLQ